MEVKLLGPGFFAEVRGAGLADVVASSDTYAAVRAAFDEYSVLLFRGQSVTDESQAAFSRRFGPLEIAKVASLGEGTPFSILTNIDRETGGVVPPGHKELLRAAANQLWHTDSTFKNVAGSGGLSAGPTELEGVYAMNWAQNIWADSLV